MLKKEILDYVDKGPVKIGEATVEFSFSDTTGSLYLNIVQKAINPYTTDRHYNGGFWEYTTDESFADIEKIIKETHTFMLKQESIYSIVPIVLTKHKDYSDIYIGNDNKLYKKQDNKGYFEILVLSNGEPDYSINIPVTIDGKTHYPVWSWWLDCGCFLKEN